jgi:mannitol-specific phosphotransferase system IIBC component
MEETAQRAGGFLAGMITTNIGATIARGLDMDNLITL